MLERSSLSPPFSRVLKPLNPKSIKPKVSFSDGVLVSQAKNARDAAQSLAALVHEEGVRLCITHGNGPQVGRLAEQASHPQARH